MIKRFGYLKRVMQRNKPGTKVLRPLRPLVGQVAVPQVLDPSATKKVVASDSHVDQETREIEARPEVVERGSKIVITDSPSGRSDLEPTLLPQTSVVSDKGVDLSARLPEPVDDRQHKKELFTVDSNFKESARNALPIELPQKSEAKTEINPSVRTETVHKEIRSSEDSDKKQKAIYAAPKEAHQARSEERTTTSSHKLEEPSETAHVAPVKPNVIRQRQLQSEKVEPRTVSVFAKPLPSHIAVRPQVRPRPDPPHGKTVRPVVEIGTIEVRVLGKKEVALPTPEPRMQIKSPSATKPSRLARSSLAVYGWRQS